MASDLNTTHLSFYLKSIYKHVGSFTNSKVCILQLISLRITLNICRIEQYKAYFSRILQICLGMNLCDRFDLWYPILSQPIFVLLVTILKVGFEESPLRSPFKL